MITFKFTKQQVEDIIKKDNECLQQELDFYCKKMGAKNVDELCSTIASVIKVEDFSRSTQVIDSIFARRRMIYYNNQVVKYLVFNTTNEILLTMQEAKDLGLLPTSPYSVKTV